MTAANSTPLSDGASAVLLASEEWAKEHGLPVLAYLTEAQTAAVDHVHKREGLLMAPAYAMPRMLERAGARDRRLRLLRDPRGLRGAGALHAGGLGGRRRSARRSSASTAPSARSTAPSSTSTAAASPPATRSRRPAGGSSPALAKQLHEDGKGRGVISICAAGGQGVVAVLESAGGAVMSDERPLRAARQRPGRSRRSPASSACRGRSSSSATARASRSSAAAVLCGAAPGARLERPLKADLDRIGVERAGAEGKAKALVFDASGIADSTELVELQRFFYPGVGRLQRNGRAIVLGIPAAEAGSTRAATAQRALEGFTRSLGKEIGGRGATAQLVLVGEGGEDQLESTLRFLLSPQLGLCLRAGDPGRQGSRTASRARLGAPAGGQDGAGHRRLPRDRRRDRGDPRPRRGAGRRPRRPAGGRRARRRHRGDRRRRDRARHHRAGGPGADRRALRRRHRRRSSTTPASPRTGRSRKCPRSAGRR